MTSVGPVFVQFGTCVESVVAQFVTCLIETLKLMLINLQSIHFQRSPYFRQKFLFLKFSPSLLNSFTIRIGSDGRTDKQDLFLRGYASKNYG